MKTGLKKLSIVALVLSFVMGVSLLTACGVDYSTYKYPDFAAIPLSDWDAKSDKISYQFVGDVTQKDAFFVDLINCYSDGSLIYLQGICMTGGGDDWIWGSTEYNCRWVNYGTWEESADGLALHITHYYDDTCAAEVQDLWIDVTAWTEGSGYVITAGSLPQWFMGQDDGGNLDYNNNDLKGSSTVVYSTFSAWFTAWKPLIAGQV